MVLTAERQQKKPKKKLLNAYSSDEHKQRFLIIIIIIHLFNSAYLSFFFSYTYQSFCFTRHDFMSWGSIPVVFTLSSFWSFRGPVQSIVRADAAVCKLQYARLHSFASFTCTKQSVICCLILQSGIMLFQFITGHWIALPFNALCYFSGYFLKSSTFTECCKIWTRRHGLFSYTSSSEESKFYIWDAWGWVYNEHIFVF